MTTPEQLECLSCGLCCMGRCSPPFNFEETRNLPHDVYEDWATRRKVRIDQLMAHETTCSTCTWFNTLDRTCRHYEHRPQACRDFEPGSTECNELRTRAGREPI